MYRRFKGHDGRVDFDHGFERHGQAFAFFGVQGRYVFDLGRDVGHGSDLVQEA